MKRENFEEVKKLITQIERLESLLRDLEIVSDSSRAEGRSVIVNLFNSQAFIPNKYDFITITYIVKLRNEVSSDLKEMNEELLKL